MTGFHSNTRKLLQAQLSLMGIAIVSDFSASVTHLICARFEGAKFETAQKFNIRTVDRGWVDLCYSNWRIMN